MLPRKKEVVTVVCICIFAALFVYFLYRPTVDILNWGRKRNLSKEVYAPLAQNYSSCEAFKGSLKRNYWNELNLQNVDIPSVVKAQASFVEVKSSKVFVKDAAVHYLYVKPKKPKTDRVSVLLLHGQSFSAATWENVGTVQVLGALGYHTVAVDLPGFGKSPNTYVEDKGAFLRDLIKALQIAKPVIVSPSMSGSFSLPYVTKEWESVSGFVPVSPTGTRFLKEDACADFKESCPVIMDETCKSLQGYIKNQDVVKLCCVQVPVMVVFGEHDRGPSSARLCHLPWSRAVQIPNGKHAAYLNNPDFWHKILYNFLIVVEAIDLCN